MKRQNIDYTAEYPAQQLNEKGQCCGRKPIVYKRPNFHYFCDRCDRTYDKDEKQIESWGWVRNSNGTFTRRGSMWL